MGCLCNLTLNLKDPSAAENTCWSMKCVWPADNVPVLSACLANNSSVQRASKLLALYASGCSFWKPSARRRWSSLLTQARGMITSPKPLSQSTTTMSSKCCFSHCRALQSNHEKFRRVGFAVKASVMERRSRRLYLAICGGLKNYLNQHSIVAMASEDSWVWIQSIWLCASFAPSDWCHA